LYNLLTLFFLLSLELQYEDHFFFIMPFMTFFFVYEDFGLLRSFFKIGIKILILSLNLDIKLMKIFVLNLHKFKGHVEKQFNVVYFGL
jgi:hypothetical protein